MEIVSGDYEMPGKVQITENTSAGKFVLETDAPELSTGLALIVTDITKDGVISIRKDTIANN